MRIYTGYAFLQARKIKGSTMVRCQTYCRRKCRTAITTRQCLKLQEKTKIGPVLEAGGRAGNKQGYEAAAMLAGMAKRLLVGSSGGGG